MSCNVEGQIDTDITNILNSLQQSVQNYAAIDAIKALLETNKNGSCKGLTNEVIHTIIDTLLSNQNFKSNPRISFNLHQFKSLLYFQQRELDPAVQHLEVAFSISPDIDTASMIVYYLTTAGLMDEALQSIQHFSSALPYNPVLRKQWTLRLKAMEHEIRNKLSNMPST